MRRLLTLLVMFGVGACRSLGGLPVSERSEWSESVAHVAEYGLLRPGCGDMPARYKLVSDYDWLRTGHLSNQGGYLSDDNVVVVRENGCCKVSAGFILRHEFTHLLLRCSGVPENEHRAHLGPVWDGLRGTL